MVRVASTFFSAWPPRNSIEPRITSLHSLFCGHLQFMDANHNSRISPSPGRVSPGLGRENHRHSRRFQCARRQNGRANRFPGSLSVGRRPVGGKRRSGRWPANAHRVCRRGPARSAQRQIYRCFATPTPGSAKHLTSNAQCGSSNKQASPGYISKISRCRNAAGTSRENRSSSPRRWPPKSARLSPPSAMPTS